MLSAHDAAHELKIDRHRCFWLYRLLILIVGNNKCFFVLFLINKAMSWKGSHRLTWMVHADLGTARFHKQLSFTLNHRQNDRRSGWTWRGHCGRPSWTVFHLLTESFPSHVFRLPAMMFYYPKDETQSQQQVKTQLSFGNIRRSPRLWPDLQIPI